MSLAINPDLESQLRARAESEGLTIEAYLERLLLAEQEAVDELHALALEGLRSGEPSEMRPEDWDAKHRRLDARLRKTVAP